MRAVSIAAAFLLGSGALGDGPAGAAAQARCTTASLPEVEIASVRCPSVPSPSYCLYWETAEGTFVPTSFRAEEGKLWLDGTFSGIADAFMAVEYTLTDAPASLLLGSVKLTASKIEIATEVSTYGPFFPTSEPTYTTVMSVPYADEQGPGLYAVDIAPVTLTAQLHKAGRAVSRWRRAEGDPALQAEILNELLFR